MGPFAVARQVFNNRDIVVAELGFMIFTIVMQGAWVATLLYAFSQGGVGEAGLVAVGVLVPAAISGPFVAVLFDRLEPHHAMAAGFGVQGLALLLTATAIWAGWPALIVYSLIGLLSIGQTATRPSVATLVPRLARDAAELVAANSASGLIENVGFFLGPGAVALTFLVTDQLAVPFAVSAIAMLLAAGMAISVETSGDDFQDEATSETIVSQVRDGLVLLRSSAEPRRLVLLLAVGHLVMGALEIGVVAIGIDQLNGSQATAGLLASIVGVGGVIGGALTFVMVGQRRLSLPFALGIVVSSAPVMLLAGQESLIAVLLLFALIGFGRPIVYVAGRTLLQSLSAEDTLARIFGLLEGLSVLALAVGSIGFSQLVVAVGLPTALLATGLIPVALLALQFPQLRAIDKDRPEVNTQMLALVRGVPIFAPLPAFRLEQMLMNMQTARFDPDTVVFLKGAKGALMHVVTEGSAIVELSTGDLAVEPGGFFGEVALLSDQPRNATVRAGPGGLGTYTLEGDVFMSAISTASRSLSRTDQLAKRRRG